MIVTVEAVTAAADALLRAEYKDDPGPAGAFFRARARIALEAAAPLIAAAERERIRQLAIEAGAVATKCRMPGCDGPHHRPFTDLLKEPS
jgi:hypothetical protein